MKTMNGKPSFVFTGWHMAGVMVLFFGTVISVNLVMAWFATTSWSGLVVKNTYVASQEFNAKAAAARAMAATGIRGALTVTGGTVRYELSHPQDGPVDADAVTVRFKRPVGEHQDFAIDMTPVAKGVFAGAHAVLPGQWIVEATSTRAGEIIMHEAIRITVAGGAQ